MDPVTAARITASPSANSARSQSTASTSTSRLAHAGSASGLNNEYAISSSQLTADQLIAQHANSHDPTRAALEAVLNERNSLSAQNSQLWNHLKKQRNNYQLAASDVKRLRGERDLYKAKLQAADKSGRDERHDERRLRPSASAANMSASIHGPLPNDSTISEGSPSRRPTIERIDSEDSTYPSITKPLSLKEHRFVPRQPSRGQLRERSSTNPEFTTNGSFRADSPKSPILPNGEHHTTSPPPLLIPSRAESLASGSTFAGSDLSPSQQIVVHDNVKQVEDPLGTAKPSTVGSTIPFINAPAENGETSMSLDPRMLQNNSSAPSSSFPPPVSLTPNYLASGLTRKASRESRISLPDEMKRYYANLAESPLNSPRIDYYHSGASANGLSNVPEESDSKGNDSASPRPFLELETTDDSESEHRMSGDARGARETDSEVDPDGDGDEVDGQPKRGGSPTQMANNARTRGPPSHTATADQFPLPPSSLVSPLSASPQSPTRTQGPNGTVHAANVNGANGFGSSTANDVRSNNAQASGANRNPSSGPVPSVSSSSTLVPETSQRRKEKADSFIMPTTLPPGTFRQMPLLNTDLKSTTVEVLGSHIRANDKGKEVLSFVIVVRVVGKEAWQIEKFYSDVLALDNRLRTMCGRSTLKKIEPLPDNKLFKDHAPAKVDQRKRMLQAYLQSVINLPLKDKNDIVVFFSSDIMRERSPVTKNGYKEGYLTKRGKNFGGWKTRYFVLQGPVLEYYESRGGTHLGSIQITGAQIGRQQKGAGRGDDDDDNEFRHAFLIIEQKRGPATQNTRHVLCAESDKERDAWVEVLVKYVMGSYDEFDRAGAVAAQMAQARTSTSSLSVNEVGNASNRRTVSKDLIQRSDMNPVPISQLSMDGSYAKFFTSAGDPMSPSKSPVEKGSVNSLPFGDAAKTSLSSDDAIQSSSLPVGSVLSDANPTLVPIGQRSNSELGHYPDMSGPGRNMSQEHRHRDTVRASYHPSLGTVSASPRNRSISPEKLSPATPSPSTARDDVGKLGKISGPLNGAPIPAGYKFGAKEPPPSEPQAQFSERERKTRSRAFWKWPSGADKAANTPAAAPPMQVRAVFGVPLEEALSVSQIANLPSIVFRSIQYLEMHKADEEEGIYRLSGSSAVIKNLKDRFNAEGDVDLLEADVRDPHAIAGLLKTFLRELPSSLLTRDLHMQFLSVIDFVDTDERVRELQVLISRLPFANYSLLRALTAHLIRIVQNSNVNKMTMRNVGIVFSPTLGIPAGVFSLMLGEFNRVFNVNGEGSDSSIEEESTEVAATNPRKRHSDGLSRRNSQRYSDAAADQLLGLSGRTLPEEDKSDDGEDAIDGDESDEENTENEEPSADTNHVSQSESHSYNSHQGQQVQREGSPALHIEPPVDDPYSHSRSNQEKSKSRASVVASSRGLNLNLTGSGSKNDRRRSRLPGGLPTSPWPPGHGGSSPLSTPTLGSQQR